jgi:hypothetical protein
MSANGTNNEIVSAHFFTQVLAPLSMVKSKDKRTPKYDEPQPYSKLISNKG